MTVKAGEPFEVRLEGKASSGYLWEVRQLPTGLVFLGNDMAPPQPGEAPDSPHAKYFGSRHFRPENTSFTWI